MSNADEVKKLLSRYIQHYNACIKDSDRIASLVLVGKLLRHANCSTEIRRLALRQMDLSFIGRMLSSNSTVKDDDGTFASLQESAVSILHFWACDEELMQDHSFLRLLRKLGGIITVSAIDCGEATPVCVSDVYQIFNLMMDHVNGRVAILEQDVVPLLCQAIQSGCRDNEKAVDILKCLSRCHEGILWDLNATNMHQVISSLIEVLHNKHDLASFSRFEDIRVLLLGVKDNCETCPHWMEDLSTILLKSLKSEISPSQRRVCLQLAAELSQVWAFEWMMSQTPQDLFLLIQMACIEAGVIIEYSVTFDKTFAEADVLIPCFILLETTLHWLSSDNGPPAPDFMSQLIGRLDDTFSAVSRMLIRWLKGTSETCWKDGETKAFVSAIVRVVGVWLAQDEWVKPECERLPPDLLIVLRDIGSHELDWKEEKEDDDVDVLRFLLPGLCLTSADDSQREVLMRTEWPPLIARYVVFRIEHMRGSVDEVSRAICSALNVLFNFLLEKSWPSGIDVLIQSLMRRWQHLNSLSSWRLSLHLSLFFSSILTIDGTKLTNRCKLNVFEIILSIFEKRGKLYRRSAAVIKDWEDIEGLWLLSAQLLADAMEKDNDLVLSVKQSGFSEHLDSIIAGLEVKDPCYKSLKAMKSTFVT